MIPGSALLDGIDSSALRERLRSRELACIEVAQAFLDAAGEDPLHAWSAIDPDALRGAANQLDRLDEDRRGDLPLYGVPVAVKDNFDTAELATAYGSPIYAGSRPNVDAAAVRRLRGAGALIVGKTKCTEFAWMTPPDTLNPLDRRRTPGGSSSGSAAAVAAGTVPLATGTQTAGSINRPASYCGVLGYKPSFGLLARDGVKPLAHSLDTVGLFARTVSDLRLGAEVMAGRPLGAGALRSSPPRLAFARTVDWELVEPDAQASIETALARLRAGGGSVEELELPGCFTELVAAQRTIQYYESAEALRPELEGSSELLSDELREALLEGAAMPRERYLAATRAAAELAPALTPILERYDGVLTPSATGVPPLGLSFTGDPRFCRAWTLLGAPCVSVPLAWTAESLPAGLQVVGAPGSDARTLAATDWLTGASRRVKKMNR